MDDFAFYVLMYVGFLVCAAAGVLLLLDVLADLLRERRS